MYVLITGNYLMCSAEIDSQDLHLRTVDQTDRRTGNKPSHVSYDSH